MKFCAKDQDKAITIREFKIVDDNIVIYFLDDSTYELPFTKKNVESVMKLMIKQAKYRNSCFNTHDVYMSTLLSFCLSILCSGISLLSLYGSFQKLISDNQLYNVYSYLTIVFLSLSSLELNSACIGQEKAEELEKYQLYLELIDKNLLNIYNDSLNINKLDDCSLSRVKKYYKEVSK